MKRCAVFLVLLLLLPSLASAFVWSSAAERTLEQMLDTSGKVSILTVNGRAAPALSPLGQGRIYFDASANLFKASVNGGAYATLGGAGASTDLSDSTTLARKTDNLSVFAATTSAQLAGVLSDETGTGAAVFADSPTFVTKALFPTGTAAVPGITFAVEPTSGFIRSTLNRLAVVIAGTPRILFTGDVSYGLQLSVNNPLSWSSFADVNNATDTFLRRFAANNLQLGNLASATPIAQTLSAQDGAGTDIAGQPWTLRASRGTGAGAVGTLVLLASAAPLGTGATLQTAVAHQTIGGGWSIFGGVVFASLGSPANGALTYCSDCDPPSLVNTTCTSAGAQTGALAFRLNGAWKCLS